MRPVFSVLLCLVAACCGGRSSSTTVFVVRSVTPGPSEAPAELYLNQEITVAFSAPIDALKVTADNFCVLDADGHSVPGEIVVGRSSVSFKPRPPVSASFQDGSFRPEAEYRLVVAGYPRLDGIRSTTGQMLDESVFRSFRAVSLGTDRSPLLPVGTGTEVFALDVSPEWPLRMAADEAVLRLRFTLPVLPSSLSPKAFRVLRIVATESGAKDSDSIQELIPTALSVVEEPSRRGHYPGCDVEIAFDPGLNIRRDDLIFVILSGDEHALQDYRGRRVWAGDNASSYQVAVDPGDRIHLIDRRFADIDLFQRDASRLGFAIRKGKAMVNAWREAGRGKLGWLRPQQDLVMTAEAFGLAPGEDFEFMGLDIPIGVTVTLRSKTAVVIRVCGPTFIRGQLLLETTRATKQWTPHSLVTSRELISGSSVALVVGGDLHISGSIRHSGAGVGSPMTLFSSGALDLSGGIVAAGCVFAREGAKPPSGAAEDPVLLDCEMQPGTSAHAPIQAEAWTEWMPLPEGHPMLLDVETVGLEGALQVAVQVATPHPVDPSMPLDAPGALQQPVPLPLGVPLEVSAGAFLRFRLQAYPRPGAFEEGGIQPSVAGIAVFAH